MGFDVQSALDAGYTQSEIDSHLSTKDVQPIEPAQEPLEATTVEEPVQEPLATEKPVEATKAIPTPLEDSDEYTTTQVEPVAPITQARQQPNKEEFARQQQEQITDLSDLYKNRHQKYSTTGKSVLGSLGGLSSHISSGLFKAPEMKMAARRDVVDLNKHIASKLVEEGFDAFISPNTGEIMYKDEGGNELEVDSSILNDLWNSKYETGGAIAGAIAGGQAANVATSGIPPVTLPTAVVKGLAVTGGAVVGGFVGASTGRTLDLLMNSMMLKEDLEAGLVMNQAIEAGYYDTVTTIIGGTALKAVGKIGRAGWKGVGKAYSLVADGNSKGALKYLKESFNLSDDAAKEITQKFIGTLSEEPTVPAKVVGKMIGQKMRPLSETEKQILAITSTQEGGERILATVAKDNLKVANSMSHNIDTRAKEVQKLVTSQTDKNVGSRITEDLNIYEADVKDFYAQVKHIGGELIDGTDFRFNIDNIGMEGVLEGLKSNNKSNPDYLAALETFIGGIESRSNDRTFTGLIDLRQSVNDFKYSKLVSKTNKVKGKKTEFDAVNEVINGIDGQINKAVKDYMPSDVGKEWASQWQKSKEAYSKMSKLKKNAVLSYVRRGTATEEGIQQQLNRYGNDLDVDARVFNDMVEVLQPKTKVKVENAAVKNLVNKHTAGVDSSYQAIDFPSLADELAGLNITTAEGKHVVKTIDKLSKIYKNDALLSRVSGGVSLKQSGDSSIATTIEGKARAKLVHDVWNVIQKINPTKNILSENALINKLDVLMADPLKQKGVDDFLKSMPDITREQTRTLVKTLQIEMTKAGQRAEAKQTGGQKAFRKMYKQSATGKFVKSEGALGKGVYLVDKVKKPNPSSKVLSTEINLSKMIDIDKISSVLGRDVPLKEIRSAPVRKELQDKGYEGLISSDGNKAMLFESVD